MPYADIAPLYRDLNLAERFYARARYGTAPLERVVALVPAETASLVEIGCSAGVFANLLKTRRPALEVIGVDADERKIATAVKTVKGRTGINFLRADAFAYLQTSGPHDAVAFVDVLYLFPPVQQDELILLAARALKDGGVVIVKEMHDYPVWKRRWCRLQEWVAVRVVGATEGTGIHLRPGGEYPGALAAAGLEVEAFDLNRGYLHPHFAWRGRKK